MRNIGFGILVEDNDMAIRAFLESEDVWGLWLEQRASLPYGTDAIMIYGHSVYQELWLIQEYTGVPGDEGMTLHRIPVPVIEHPVVQDMIYLIEKSRGIKLPSKEVWEAQLANPHFKHYPKPDRN